MLYLVGCSSDKEEHNNEDEVEPSMLGLHSYWDSTYVEELANFHEHGHTGEIWYVKFYHMHNI